MSCVRQGQKKLFLIQRNPRACTLGKNGRYPAATAIFLGIAAKGRARECWPPFLFFPTLPPRWVDDVHQRQGEKKKDARRPAKRKSTRLTGRPCLPFNRSAPLNKKRKAAETMTTTMETRLGSENASARRLNCAMRRDPDQCPALATPLRNHRDTRPCRTHAHLSRLFLQSTGPGAAGRHAFTI